MKHIQAAVIGASGYTGAELTRLLVRHPSVRPPRLFRLNADDAGAGDIPLNGNAPIEPFEWDGIERESFDVLFFCTPHEVSRELIPRAIARGFRVVDLSGAWRIKRGDSRAVYGFEDADPDAANALDASSIYGLPELHANEIGHAQLVANPGCYATSIILALTPWVSDGLLDLEAGVISDSKSGVSGAGKAPSSRTHFVEVSDNLSAYSVFGHRHTGEILEQLGLEQRHFQFTPHLLPIPRGILSTIYVRAACGVTAAELDASLRDHYADRPFVRVFGSARLPEIKFSLHTNYCDIGFSMEPDGNRVVLLAALDNLVKGAAGQAVQNMNLMLGRDEREGLQ
ncbi:MAG TPA: N-acetyl-gamma-glutamyl-phosphate reductase [Candidatus Krumholzibacteria bacterium]|nr:N-acetyl-gamma-glutamyl-phosphate reductase [Candidatus Krumholzibacteria bacterium]